jgi:type IV pilus assembly protein PilN
MIRINLLPLRAARKKENVRRQVSVFCLCLVFAFCVMAYLAISTNRKISKLNQGIELAQSDLKKYETIAKQVNKIRKELRKLEAKMDVIVKLEANRTGPVRFMDALTNYVVADKMWLKSLTEKNGTIKLAGVASDNKTVADFMTRLEESPVFGGVDLISSKQVKLKQDKKFKEFILTCMLSRQPQKKPTTP